MGRKLWISVACLFMLALTGCDMDKHIQETEKTESTEKQENEKCGEYTV